MKTLISTLLVIAFAGLLPLPVSAQTETVPSLTASQFSALNLFFDGGPGATDFSSGWDIVESTKAGIAENGSTQIVRMFYRKSDGLLTFVLEQDAGYGLASVIAQSPVWQQLPGMDTGNITLFVRDGTAHLQVFLYDRETGKVVRRVTLWPWPRP